MPLSSSSSLPDSSSRHYTYSRKQKSLGVLCSNFLTLYNKDGIDLIGLDEAAARLGVERRRIYDIVNVLESVGVLTRRAKNRYTWKGFGAIPKALQDLKTEMISLDDAAKLLLGNAHNTSIMRTKVRRLYDIANVLSSMNLIEKTHTIDTRKPAFRWLGYGENSEKRALALALDESRKRAFGTDVTNICSKRNKGDQISNDANRFMKMQKKIKVENMVTVAVADRSCLEDSKQGPKSYQFGPFAPVNLANIGNSENNVRRAHDLESLASTYRPQYQNQALSDLFSHYKEAWKSWYTEVAGKKPVQQIS
ncbi:hypothetical protein CCACVL1_17766 [Corchorus capsularis]|uniref:E2F/DP family winged-helix DNA-binding domain-containing protein n=1 Tax=Corchorus capsularis TaxID=210143 RepID=A0A1R3HQ81_COCAP|nr:hypothetical protein CCACVL1_17766 [Corchorus capsularis]